MWAMCYREVGICCDDCFSLLVSKWVDSFHCCRNWDLFIWVFYHRIIFKIVFYLIYTVTVTSYSDFNVQFAKYNIFEISQYIEVVTRLVTWLLHILLDNSNILRINCLLLCMTITAYHSLWRWYSFAYCWRNPLKQENWLATRKKTSVNTLNYFIC